MNDVHDFIPLQRPLLRAAALACALLPALGHAQAGAAYDRAATHATARNACAVQDFQALDTANTILYGDVMRALSAHERPALRKDQSAWSRQRTIGCKAAHQRDEHLEDWPARYHQCLAQATAVRRAALLHWLHHGQAPGG